jgi:hypothetical protein
VFEVKTDDYPVLEYKAISTIIYITMNVQSTSNDKQESEAKPEIEMLFGCQASLLDFLAQLPLKPDLICFQKTSIHTTDFNDIMYAFVTLRGKMWIENAMMIGFRVLSILFLLELKRCEMKGELSKVIFSHTCSNGEVHELCAKEFYFCGYSEIKSRLGNRYEDVLRLDMRALQECLDERLSELTHVIPDIDAFYDKCCHLMTCEVCAAKVHALILPAKDSGKLRMRREN